LAFATFLELFAPWCFHLEVIKSTAAVDVEMGSQKLNTTKENIDYHFALS
jgi:hypothetical protein